MRAIRYALAFLLVAALALFASPLPAQTMQRVEREPPVPKGMVAVRVLNGTDCVMALRLTVNGERKGIIPIPEHDWRSVHLQPDSAKALEVEVLATPKLCAPLDSVTESRLPFVRPSPNLAAWTQRRLGLRRW